VLRGRRGHARVIVLTVVEEEMTAVLKEFRATVEVLGSACWATSSDDDSVYPVLVTQTEDRSNMPALNTVRDLVEDWQPECIVLAGIAGGIARTKENGTSLAGPEPGDVICAEYIHYGEYTKRVDGMRLMRYYPIAQPDSHLIQSHLKPLARQEWYRALPERPDGSTDAVPQVQFGEIVAVEFLAGDARSEAQREIFGQYDHALAVDMESAGVARAMHRASSSVHYRPVWLCVRGISDRTAADQAAQDLLSENNDAERVVWRPYAAAAAARLSRRLVERLLAEARPPGRIDPGAPAWGGTGD
jgi:nucleoside phosphorylase